jgi:sugar/nucleoside kinase (ribokinase family)
MSEIDSILVMGTVSIDHIKQNGETVSRNLGGGALNFAIGCKVGGKTPYILSVVGDNLTDIEKVVLQTEFPRSSISILRGKTCQFDIEYSSEWDDPPKYESNAGVAANLTSYLLGQEMDCSRAHVSCRWPLLPADVLDRLTKRGVKNISIDFIYPSLREQLSYVIPFLRFIDFIFVNEKEFTLLSQVVDLQRLECSLVVTEGSRGSKLIERGEIVHRQPSVPIPSVVDPTGAGDVYAGSFIASVHDGLPIMKAMSNASIAAALSLSDFGVLHLLMGK